MLFSYIAPIGAKSFACCFFYKYFAPLELKTLILLGFYKKVGWALPILPKTQKATRINSLWITKKYNFLCNKKGGYRGL
jgi:hypothetical protein